MQASTIQIATTWGSIGLQVSGGRVVRCTLPFLADQPEKPFRILNGVSDDIIRFIIGIFNGERAPRPPFTDPDGTPFQQQVWREIARIPAGRTITYRALAQAVGRPRAYRAVANACGKNPLPIFIPCHRVVGSDGTLGGYSSGLPWKRLLLAVEQGIRT